MSSQSRKTPPPAITRVASGLPELDTVLGGGLIQGSCYILQGSPGTGKTILANQICFSQAKHGKKSLYLTLLSESFTQMFGFMGSLDFFDITKVPKHIYYVSAYQNLRSEGTDALLRLILQEIRKHRPAILVFDGAIAIEEMFTPPNRESMFRRFVNELSGVAIQHQVTIILVTNSDRNPSSPEYTMVDGWIELLDDLTRHHPSRSLIVHKHRGGPMFRGRHEYRITNQGITLFPRIESLPQLPEQLSASTNRLRSGVEGFDRMMGGGIPEYSATAVIGPTGSGKTSIGLHFLADATPEQPALFVGFYEEIPRLCRRAEAIGVDLEKGVACGAITMRRIAPADYLLDEIGHNILNETASVKARKIVLDGLHETCRPLADATRLRIFLRCLNDRLLALKATVLYTYEVPQLFFPDALRPGQFSGLVDNTLLLHYARSGHRVERKATILKVRDSDFDHTGRTFRITDKGLILDEPIASRPEIATADPQLGDLQATAKGSQ
ncbi:AAA family ATPase [Jiella sp. MQZ9-1]|uniref:non-specific serine/threonine protein kinase n=1 Tax=Jiella flava TaxID=2816857 RepID=A0A939JWW6_9HYPH|nr:ATPase domain-containing protein [Jiella flava]MBO0663457.1 AAA family ATPase [Jiella flava]MCD2472032.1 AAA family ATPase [Jiella flava]